MIQHKDDPMLLNQRHLQVEKYSFIKQVGLFRPLRWSEPQIVASVGYNNTLAKITATAVKRWGQEWC
jgi:hypothetical protein